MDTKNKTSKHLQGTGIGLSDVILQKDISATAGSRILSGFSPLFDATVVERLVASGRQITGRIEIEEFGIPDLFDNEDRSTDFLVDRLKGRDFSSCLCNDLFGSYRQFAAREELFYLHPTYGTVSRYGLIPLASSMDAIGVLARDIHEGFDILKIISGKDEKDGVMEQEFEISTTPQPEMTFYIPDNVLSLADEDTQRVLKDLSALLKAKTDPLSDFDYYKDAMFVLSAAEISNNLARYDGIKYGFRTPEYRDLDELYVKTRSEGFDSRTKYMILFGAMFLSGNNYNKYFQSAAKLRRAITQELSFEDYNFILLPAELNGNKYDNLSLTAVTALTGLPSLSFNYKGAGLLLVAYKNGERALEYAGKELGL